MTDDETRILAIALLIARRAPARKGTYSHSAQIPWTLINDLRAAFARVGIDWKKDTQHKEHTQ